MSGPVAFTNQWLNRRANKQTGSSGGGGGNGNLHPLTWRHCARELPAHSLGGFDVVTSATRRLSPPNFMFIAPTRTPSKQASNSNQLPAATDRKLQCQLERQLGGRKTKPDSELS